MTDAPPAAAQPAITVAELPYHRLLRAQPTYRWWRPLLAILLLAIFVIVENLLIVLAVFVVVLLDGSIDPTDPAALESSLLVYFVPDAANPVTLVIGLGSVALWLPLVPLALLCAGIRPAGFLTNITHSVTFRLRGRWLALCLVPAVVVMTVSFAVSLGVGLAVGDELGAFTTPAGIYAVSLALILLLVPFQAAAEEYVFRGVMFQAIGSWLRWLPVAILVTTVAFASLHIYELWGMLDVAAFGVTAAILAWRTGGLEAAIALHAVNNILGLAVMGTGAFGPTAITPEGGSPGGLAVTIVTMAVYTAVVLLLAKRTGIERLSRIGVPVVPGIAPPPAR